MLVEQQLLNQTIRVGLFQYPPYIRIDDNNKVIGGFEGHMLSVFEEYFNLTTEKILFHDFGHKESNGTWSGMLGGIYSNRIDMAFGSVVLIYERYSEINFLDPHWIDHHSYGMISPESNSNNLLNELYHRNDYMNNIISDNFQKLLQPYEKRIWFCLSMIFILFMMYELLKKLLTTFKNFNDDNNTNHMAFLGLKLLLNQSNSDRKHLSRMFVSKKFIFILWAFSVMTLNNIYLSYLYSIISIPMDYHIDNIDKLALECQQNRLKIYVPKDSFLSNRFSLSHEKSLKTLANCLRFIDHFEDKFRAIIRHDVASNNADNNHCELNAIVGSVSKLVYIQNELGRQTVYLPPFNELSYFYQLLIAIPISWKLKPYKRKFGAMTQYLRASGLFLHWRNKEMVYAKSLNLQMDAGVNIDDDSDSDESNDNSNHTNNDTNSFQFQFKNLEYIFIVFIIGSFIGICCLLIEILIKFSLHKYQHQHQSIKSTTTVTKTTTTS